MSGIRMPARLLVCVAMLLHGCRSQSCLDSQSGRTYNLVLVSERSISCMDQGTGVDLVASSKCECAQRTEEADLNTFRYSEDGCRAFRAVPVASHLGENGEMVELYVAAVPTGDTALPPDNGPTVTGLTLNIVDMSALVAEWDGVGEYKCRAVAGYRVHFSDPNIVSETMDLTEFVAITLNVVCGDYSVTVTALDGDGNTFGSPATASADLPPAYELECCSPPFVMSDAGCVFPVGCDLTFNDSRQVCQAYGADLYISPSVADTYAFSAVVAQLTDIPVTWVGARKVGGNFTWLDGRAVDAEEWYQAPNIQCPSPGSMDCVFFDTSRLVPLCNELCYDYIPFFCSAPKVNECGDALL